MVMMTHRVLTKLKNDGAWLLSGVLYNGVERVLSSS